jgi:hypothetical protein
MDRNAMNSFVRLISIGLIFSISALISCGGGSAGTGTTTFTGKLVNTENEPVQGATVSIVGSGEIVTTDEQGRFTLSADDKDAPVQLQVQSTGVNTSVTVPPASSDESKVGIQLELNENTATVSVRSTEASVSMVGDCEKYFNQSKTSLIQIRPLPDQSKCLIRVSARAGGRPVGGVLAEIQRSSCSYSPEWDKTWITVASGRTKQSNTLGRVDIKFTFFDDDAHCQYRVVAPVGDREKTPLIFPIVTLREQQQE